MPDQQPMHVPDHEPLEGVTAPESSRDGVGKQVMSILEDVEKQFDRLRDVQCQQAAEVATLADRAAELDDRARVLEQETQTFRRQREEHDASHQQAQQSLAERRTALELEMEQAGARLAQQKEQLSQERGELDRQATTLETEAQRLRDETETLSSQRQTLESDRQAIETRRAELAAEQQRLETQVSEFGDYKEKLAEAGARAESLQAELAELGRQRDDVEQRLQASGAENETLTARVAEIEEQLGQHQAEAVTSASRIESLQGELDELDRQRGGMEQRLQAAGTENETLTGRIAELEQDLVRTREQAETTETEAMELIHDVEQQRDALRTELDERQTHMERLEQQLDESQRNLEVAGTKLTRFAEMLKEQGPQLEQGAAAMAMLDQQKQQIERLARQLAEAKVSGDPGELRQRDERIRELTEALHQSRGQAAGHPDSFELEERNSELLGQLDQLRIKLEQTQVDASEARQQLEQHLATAATAEQADQRFEIERTALESRIHEMETELERTRGQLDQAMASSSGPDNESRAEIRMLRGENQRLAEEREEHRRREASLQDEMRRQIAHHQQALRQAQQTQQQPAQASRDADQHIDRQMQELMRRQMHLEEVRQKLATSERKMMRRWSKGRAVTAVFSLFLLLGLNAVASWYAADMVFPPEVVATATVRAAAENATDLTDEALATWKRWHTELLYNDGFQEALASRMGDLRLDQYRQADSITTLLVRDLAVDAGQPGLMTLSLTGDDAEEAQLVLDVVVSTLVAESKRLSGRKADGAFAKAMSERVENGRVRYASVGPMAIEDDRLIRAVPIFGGAMVVTLAFIGLTYARLVRAKRVFDEDEDFFAEPSSEEIPEMTATLRSVQ